MPAKHVFNYRKRGNTTADKEKKKEIPESKFEISHIQIVTQIHVH